ncbi:PREDICTED: probable G-protein coupled receptor B0563.6 [Vollenhovia emeryi]|uniref:probable G-protein coupled receptor B0563.6 n=1 Tax=Vollenhovia emeryi TaxID=411798 RepID=UPI0005F501F6|nr:PREDICTED: probable G-protein coupled receptor B0563.6 [Vollenhovia emeryi]
MNFSENLTSAPEPTEYMCGARLESFYNWYTQVHGWASLLVCIFGSIANVLNIAVLTRREMHSPTNMILTGLAVADLLVMIEYIPYAIHMYLYRRSRRDTFTYGWTIFVLFHSNFTQVCHTISICLTVTLAVWRYIAVAHPQRNREWCSNKRTFLMIAFAYVSCPILCIPLYINTEVKPQMEMLDKFGMSVNLTELQQTSASFDGVTNTTLYFVKLTDSPMSNVLKNINVWIYSVVIKLIPCMALTGLSIKLVKVLLEAKRRRKKLTTKNTAIKMGNGKENACEKHKKRRKGQDKERQTDRTTMMLLAVLLLFLVTEMPQGILGLLSVILGPSFFKTCYVMLGDVIDILTLINSAINFILYCAMSRQFRTTFNQLFCNRWRLIGRWMAVPHQPMENNGHTGTNHTVTQVTQV